MHHLDRFLDSTSALRFHFGEVFLSALARALVIVAFAVPFATVVVFEALILLAAIFHHSNLRLPRRHSEAAGARLIITPAIHWVHHHARRRDTDSNYGTIFSFWDPLFGSRSPTPRDPDMEIGVEGRARLERCRCSACWPVGVLQSSRGHASARGDGLQRTPGRSVSSETRIRPA